MIPIRETIARAVFASFAGGTSDETLDDMATAIAESAADAVLRALDEAGCVVVPREPSRAMLNAGFRSLGRAGGPVAAKWMDSAAMDQDADHVYRAMISASEEGEPR